MFRSCQLTDRWCLSSLIIFSAGISKVRLPRSISAETLVYNCRSSSMSLSSFLLWATLKNIPWISCDQSTAGSTEVLSRISKVTGYWYVRHGHQMRWEELLQYLKFDVWCILWSLSVWVDEWPSSTLPKTRKSRLNVFWLLSVGLHGLSVHFCLGLHSVGKKKL